MNAQLEDIFANSPKWNAEARRLRQLLLACGLSEELKWRQACYTSGGDNIAIIQRMNDFLSLMFFKGALMADPEGILKSQGENSRSVLRIEFTSLADVEAVTPLLQSYVDEAVRLAKSGLKVEPAEAPDYPEELLSALEEDPDYLVAFEDLTPGRRRSYLLHFNAAKQAATRRSRIEKCRSKVLEGKGFNER